MKNLNIDLPIIVCGKKINIENWMEVQEFKYDTGASVRIPKITKENIEAIRMSSNNELKALDIDEITIFLQKVARKWMEPDYELKKKAIEYSAAITGYDPCFVERDFTIISQFMIDRGEMYDQIEAELGNYRILDEWIPKHECLVHAEPRGKILHVMVGNVPIASVFTVIRGILSKNINIAKLPSRDLVTCLFFALSFFDVDPMHPITKATNVIYWTGGDEKIENEIFSMSDVVCVWGGNEAVSRIKPKVPYGAEYIEFGPKRSLSIIDLSKEQDIDKTACRMACEMSMYNQEACFCPLELYVKGGLKKDFLNSLVKWLTINSKRWPKGWVKDDINAHILITKLSEQFKGNRVIAGDNNEWTIVISKLPKENIEHPLSRTLFIYEIDEIEDVIPYISRNNQSIGVFPWNISQKYGHDLLSAGADRMCELGTHAIFRTGFPHDSIYPLARMVRWLNIERPLSYCGKYLNNLEESEFLYFGYYDLEESEETND